jgi:hypothetical protein
LTVTNAVPRGFRPKLLGHSLMCRLQLAPSGIARSTVKVERQTMAWEGLKERDLSQLDQRAIRLAYRRLRGSDSGLRIGTAAATGAGDVDVTRTRITRDPARAPFPVRPRDALRRAPSHTGA